MKVIAPPAKLYPLAALAALLLLSQIAFSQAAKDQPLNMLVLGDSISWGQGLRDEHKVSYLVKNWLEQQTGREVQQTMQAHSGALIGSPSERSTDIDDFALMLDGELSRAYPTINEQVDYAVKAFGNPARVDLVIVNGCINDVDSRRLLNAANTSEDIRRLAQAKCGLPVEALLTRIAHTFPSAHVVIIGYYPILTEKTANDLFMRTLAKRFYTPAPNAPRLNDKALRVRLIEISREWYQTSGQLLSAAAQKVDGQLTAGGSHQRVLFADPGFHIENAFAAKETRLWGFDATWVRKMLAIFTLGRVQLRSNDERRGFRSDLCKSFFRKQANETGEQKATREDRLMRCKLAAVAHPNRKGAVMYADAIGKLLKPLIGDAGWLKTAPSSK